MTDAINTNAATTIAPAAVTTRKAAFYQISLAEGRIAKANEQIGVAQARIDELNALIPTLPEQAVVDTRVFSVGESITFNAGRGPTRKQLVGVVTAVKAKEDGKVEAYRITVGEGFDAELFTALPGSVVRADGTTAEEEAAHDAGEQSADDILNDIGNA